MNRPVLVIRSPYHSAPRGSRGRVTAVKHEGLKAMVYRVAFRDGRESRLFRPAELRFLN